MEKNLAYRKNLIISADDFDSHPKIKECFFSLIKAGKIDRVGIIIDQNFSADDLQKLLISEVKLDLHLMVAGVRANHHSQNESALKRSMFFLFKYLACKINPAAIEMEWQNQINNFKEKFGKPPDGLNSHQHIHFFPPYFRVFLGLAQKNNISYVRFGKVGVLRGHTNVRRILSFFWRINRPLFGATDLTSSNFVFGLDWTENIEKFINNLPDGKTEIVCHPSRKKEYALIKRFF